MLQEIERIFMLLNEKAAFREVRREEGRDNTKIATARQW
jgi:hypothetical protein